MKISKDELKKKKRSKAEILVDLHVAKSIITGGIGAMLAIIGIYLGGFVALLASSQDPITQTLNLWKLILAGTLIATMLAVFLRYEKSILYDLEEELDSQ